MYTYFRSQIKSCPKYQGGEMCQGGKGRDSAPCCLRGQGTFQHPRKQRKCIQMGTTKQNKTILNPQSSTSCCREDKSG